jgi:hypothetical protein
MRNNKPYTYIKNIDQVAVSNSTARGFAISIANLHSIIENISGGDGNQIVVKSVSLSVRIYDDDSYFIVPVFVQTVGTFSTTADITDSTISLMLDNAVDDVFGTWVGPVRTARRKGGNDNYLVEFDQKLPQHLVNLLNKETETERLQNLSFGLVGKTYTTTGALSGRVGISVTYTVRRKDVVIR